jgi:hypothetical protein
VRSDKGATDGKPTKHRSIHALRILAVNDRRWAEGEGRHARRFALQLFPFCNLQFALLRLCPARFSEVPVPLFQQAALVCCPRSGRTPNTLAGRTKKGHSWTFYFGKQNVPISVGATRQPSVAAPCCAARGAIIAEAARRSSIIIAPLQYEMLLECPSLSPNKNHRGRRTSQT